MLYIYGYVYTFVRFAMLCHAKDKSQYGFVWLTIICLMKISICSVYPKFTHIQISQ